MNQDHLKKYCVMIESGSGCIFQPQTKDCTYILTAKHLFFDRIENERGEIDLKEKSNGTEISIKRLIKHDDFWKEEIISFNLIKHENYFPHISADIVILKIDYMAGYRQLNVNEFIDNNAYALCGYPENFRNDNVDGYSMYQINQILDSKNYYQGAQLDTVLSYENINGMSGGGLLCMNGSILSIIGIQSKMAHKYFSTGQTGFVPMKYFNEIIEYYQNKKNIRLYDLCNSAAINSENIPHLFFVNYTKSSEPYYIKRAVDDEFNQLLDQSNIWIYGKSGVGKTSLITRNLMLSEHEFCFCDLSPVTVSCPDDVLAQILSQLELQFNQKRSQTETNKIIQIVRLLCKVKRERLVILIDEFVLSEQCSFDDIVNCFTNLANNYHNVAAINGVDNKVSFVISTIASPLCIKGDLQRRGYFDFICCEDWYNDIDSLFDLLNNSLQLELCSLKEHIIESSKSSPRVLKNIVRKIYNLNTYNEDKIRLSIKKTLKEVV